MAAAWYAAPPGVARSKVKPLQQDRLSAREVRVLVLADHGRGQRTALVRVRRDRDGWSVRWTPTRLSGGGVVVALLLLGLLATIASPGSR